MTQLFLDELDREAPRTRRAVERVPTGRDDWQPHPKSMPLGRLAGLVASMPSWVTLIIQQDELDLTPPGGGQFQQPSTAQLAIALDQHVAKARESLLATQRRIPTHHELAAESGRTCGDGSTATHRVA